MDIQTQQPTRSRALLDEHFSPKFLAPQPMQSRIVKPAAPALIGILPKSRYGEVALAMAKRHAIQASRGNIHPTPTVIGPDCRVLGWSFAPHFWSKQVAWIDGDMKPLTQEAAITSYNDIIGAKAAGKGWPIIWCKPCTTAPTANNWYDLFPVSGNPAGASYSGTALTANKFDDASNNPTGGLWHGGNVSTATKHALEFMAISSGGTPMVMVYDRVLDYQNCAYPAIAANSQSMTNTNTALRYITTAGLSGMQISMTVCSVLGATAGSMTVLTYTDAPGTGTGHTVPTTRTMFIIASAATPTTALGARVVCPADTGGTLPWGPFLPLATGDSGASLIQNYTLSVASGTNAGKFCFVLPRPLAYIPTASAGIGSDKDLVMQTANIERIYDGAYLSFYAFFPAATASTITGSFDVCWN